jgi:hypothetical protein
VEGVQETPRQSEEEGKTITLIPITAQGGAGAAERKEVVEVRLRYGRKIAPLTTAGTIDLAAPPMNLPVLRLGWTLSIPPNYDLVVDHGNMRRVNWFTENELVQANPDAVPVRQSKSEPEPQQGDVQGTRNFEVIRRMSEGKAAGLPSMYSGARPQAGRLYHFQTLISLDEPGRIKSRYVKSNLGLTGKGFLVLAVIALTWVLWRLPGFSLSARLGWLGGSTLVLLAAHTLMEESYRDYLQTLVVATGGCFAASVLLAAGSAVREWNRRRQEEDILPFRPVDSAGKPGKTPPAAESPASAPTSPGTPSAPTPPAGQG